MQNITSSHKKTYYRVVKTIEIINGLPTAMYGVEGFAGGETVSVTALSPDRKRVLKLVADMNLCEMELCVLRNVVDGFLYECYDLNK